MSEKADKPVPDVVPDEIAAWIDTASRGALLTYAGSSPGADLREDVRVRLREAVAKGIEWGQGKAPIDAERAVRALRGRAGA